MTFKLDLRVARLTRLALGLAWLCPQALPAAAPPAETVLVIYTNCTVYNQDLAASYVTALTGVTPALNIKQLMIPCNAGHLGIYNDLVANLGVSDLSSFCQVYDLRFRDDKGNGFTPTNSPPQEDTITFSGANNDTLLFTNYLNGNGHLFLQGEHTDFRIRDGNLFAFISSVATVPMSPVAGDATVKSGTNPITGFQASPNSFNTIFNDISAGSLQGNYIGGIRIANKGSAQPIGGLFNDDGGQPSSFAFAWMSSDLKTNGRLVVSFETNAFAETALKAAPSVWDQWIQNVYALLSGCYRYSLSKAFDQPTLCVGDASKFTLCYSNSGSTTLTNVPLWDTLPSCLSYVSDSQGGATANGQVYSWNIPSIASGASACITVNFTVSSFSCP